MTIKFVSLKITVGTMYSNKNLQHLPISLPKFLGRMLYYFKVCAFIKLQLYIHDTFWDNFMGIISPCAHILFPRAGAANPVRKLGGWEITQGVYRQ